MRFSSPIPSLVVLLSLASAATASIVPFGPADHLLESRSTKTCKGVGEFPIPQGGVCKPCSWKFSGSSRCTTTAATKCKSGVLAANKLSCVTTCPTTQYNKSGVCTACSKSFSGASTCTASGATKCSAGYLLNGKCLGTCSTGYVNVASTKTCAACSTVSGAASCSAGKVASCKTGTYLNPGKTACVSCSSVDPNAITCSSSTVIGSCASPFTLASNKKKCQLGSTWSFYLSSSIPDIPYASIKDSTVSCGRNAVANAQPLSVWDPDSSSCYESAGVNSTLASTLVWDDNASVFIYGTCANNNKNVPSDAHSRCYDSIMTSTACTLTASGSACTTLGNNCNGNQFRNINGQCQDCQAVYDDALTCDIYNGATSCVDGDYVNNGVCNSCTDFDANAATCEATGTIDTCNYGYLPSADGTSCVADATQTPPDALANAWSYYMDSYVSTGVTKFGDNSTVSDAFDCAEQVWTADSALSAWDAVNEICYSGAQSDTTSAAIAEVDGNSVLMLGTCADNEYAVSSDIDALCNDVTLTTDSCSFADGSDCA